MEHVIASLIDDFERGRMTRRQLIQSLALSAAAASAAGAAPVATAVRGTGFTTAAVHHISYEVADYARTRDFYAGLLGMAVTNDNGRQCTMRVGDSGPSLLPRNAPRRSMAARVDHIAYTIDAWDAHLVKAELVRRGLEPRPDTDDSFHVKDPDGFDVQICGGKMKV